MALRIGPIIADPFCKSSIPQGGEIGNRMFLQGGADLQPKTIPTSPRNSHSPGKMPPRHGGAVFSASER
jgi:hypothetical protein